MVGNHHADDLLTVVAAASIVAKVHRDRVVRALADVHGPLGSGYPSDPATCRFLDDCLEAGGPLPSFVRARLAHGHGPPAGPGADDPQLIRDDLLSPCPTMLVGMDWVTVALILLAVTAYAAVVFYVRRRIAAEEAAAGEDEAVPEGGENPPSESKGWFSEHVMFYGPILALRTVRVGFFDIFRRISWPLRAYASVGVVAVVVISALFAFSLFFSLRYTLAVRPEPTGIYAPQNLLLIPGLNEFVPGTVAVWLALVITLVVHEFGHGILSRVEGIKVKAAGLLVAVVPIGAFVEPDEEELEKAPRAAKMRMYGAGITNNIVFGLLSFFLMIAVFGLAVPTTAPVVNGVYKDYPAYNASVTPGSVVLALNGTPVEDREDIARLLAPTVAGRPDLADRRAGRGGRRPTS